MGTRDLVIRTLAAGLFLGISSTVLAQGTVEQWGTYEVSLKGPTETGGGGGNPFLDVQVAATFTKGDRHLTVNGFYDGDGNYRIRFMPLEQGEWTYKTTSNRPDLDGKTGSFSAGKPTGNNHGPVHPARTFHFDYADGTPYFQIGTTCYGWVHAAEEKENQTLETLKTSPFNKVRMMILPTGYPAATGLYPYVSTGMRQSTGRGGAPATRGGAAVWDPEDPNFAANATRPAADVAPQGENGRRGGRGRGAGGGGGGGGAVPMFDYTRFDPKFWQHFEKRIADMRDLNIQADLVIYHPYGNETTLSFVGINQQGYGIDEAGDARYLKYLTARFGAYRNVWWSMANEYDLIGPKVPDKREDATWDKLCQVVKANDPFDHMLSIHFSQRIYNFKQPWITHVSIQNGSAVADFGRAVLYRDVYYKPIIFDEANYEGKGPARWGMLTGEEMAAEFWHGWIDGTYVGHGETMGGWIGSGGTLQGTSWQRIAFLKKIMEEGPATGINPSDKWRDDHMAGKPGEYYLQYFGKEMPTEWAFSLPRGAGVGPGLSFKVEVIDTWNMTITPVEGVFKTVRGPTQYRFPAEGDRKVPLPGKPYMAVRITVVK